MAPVKKPTRFVLVERERLGVNAYRVTGALTTHEGLPLTRDEGLTQMRREVGRYPGRYAPVGGTHTLVLLADEDLAGAR
jgi:hypothetical protein